MNMAVDNIKGATMSQWAAIKENIKRARNDVCRVIRNPGIIQLRLGYRWCLSGGAGMRVDIHIKGRVRHLAHIEKIRSIHTEHEGICRKGG